MSSNPNARDMRVLRDLRRLTLFVILAAIVPASQAFAQEPTQDPAQPPSTNESVTASCAVGDALAEVGLKAEALLEYIAVLKERPGSQCARRGIGAITPIPPTDDDPGPCGVADALRDAGRTELAQTAYAELLKTSPELVCAVAGLEEIATTRPCAVAETLADVGETTTAKEIYVSVLKQDPGARCALAGLEDLGESPCAVADGLSKAGLEDKAEEAYIEVLKLDPDASCARDGLADRQEDLDGALDAALGWILSVLAWLAFAAAVGIIAFFLLSRWTWTRELLVYIPLADRLLAPRLALEDFKSGGADPDVSAGVTASVRKELISASNPRQPGTGYMLDRLTGNEGIADAIKGVEALAGPLGALGAIMRLAHLLLPRARLSALGTLQAEGDLGAGVTVVLEGAPEAASTTLWTGPTVEAEDDQAAERYQSLAVPTAAWLDYEIRDALDAELPRATNSARSYALLQGGLACERYHDSEAAERYYDAALEADPANYAALLNLSNLHGRSADDPDAAVRGLWWTVALLRSRQ